MLVAGCGGSDEPSGGARQTQAVTEPGTLRALWNRPGENVGLVAGTSVYAPGEVRYSFLVVLKNSRSVLRPRARIWLARGLDAKPFQRTVARLQATGVPTAETGDEHDVSQIYVARLRIAKPGKYWLLAEPVGGTPVQGVANVVVREESASPAIGSKAPRSQTPTLASERGNLAKLTTREPPDTELLRHSVADSLAARKPFVVVFATPKFCQSRTCGPVVSVVEKVRQRFSGRDIRFIHVEIYEDNNPAKGVNRWVKEWKLPSEPWVFLVGRDGRIKAKFEGSLSVAELSDAVRRTLLQ